MQNNNILGTQLTAAPSIISGGCRTGTELFTTMATLLTCNNEDNEATNATVATVAIRDN